ncbi:GPI mannosyltransferase 1 [Coccinella septempunctata]|uniref:GPI mannosyltransferase 1 n=1 Tax=Coccinella septempunctata TaxID=41139 RepID=UPI001D079346|nr:GPI mannosyltransferase 1 [Coccinella septempunctata]
MEGGTKLVKQILSIDYKIQIIFALAIRILLIAYSVYHDSIFTVPYTDIDYKVFTDASRYVLEGKSPFERHTYRYSPLLAIILTPNILVSSLFGKFLFSVIDLFVGLLIRKIILYNIQEYYEFMQKNKFYLKMRSKYIKNISENDQNFCNITIAANTGMVVWLYNPLTIAIATRGNCDSIAGFLVLSSILCIQCKKMYFLAGVMHGLAIHFRLYPIFYSLTFFMYLSDYSFYVVPKEENETDVKKTIFKKKYLFYLIPNRNQMSLIAGCVLSLSFFITIFYYLYGYEFLHETYLYHFIRKDTRHNFSLYFYLQYLTAYIKNIPIWQKVLVSLPQLVLLVVLSVKYGLDRVSMNFGILIQTIVIVSFNTVLTSQYFVWIMVVLPICLWQIKTTLRAAFFWITIWFLAQGAWLLPAYLLEFKGQNTFIFIWLQSVAFFCANIAILGRLIMHHKPCNLEIFGKMS